MCVCTNISRSRSMVYALLLGNKVKKTKPKERKGRKKKKHTQQTKSMMNYNRENKIFALNFLRVRHRQNES